MNGLLLSGYLSLLGVLAATPSLANPPQHAPMMLVPEGVTPPLVAPTSAGVTPPPIDAPAAGRGVQQGQQQQGQGQQQGQQQAQGQGQGQGAQGAGGGGGGGGGGPMYQKNETTKELAKAAEKYQTQINSASKDAQSSMKEQTSSFLSSLDKLKVPETGDALLKEIGKGTESITASSALASKGTQAIVDDIIAATKARADTQVEIVKALALRYAPNGGPPNTQRLNAANGLESIGQKIQGFVSDRGTLGTSTNPIDNAMAALPAGSSQRTPPVVSASASPSFSAGTALSSSRTSGPHRGVSGSVPVYNLPHGVALQP